MSTDLSLWVQYRCDGCGWHEDGNGEHARVATTSDILEAARNLDYAVGNQYCLDHKLAWTDGGDCWAAGVNGMDACRIITTALLVIPLENTALHFDCLTPQGET